MVTRDSDYRGQLILIGAIALAVIIASLSITLNAVMVSEVKPRGNAANTLDDGRVYRSAVSDSLTRLNQTISDPDDLRENTTRYAQLLRNSTFRSSGATVNVSVVQTGPVVYAFTYETRTTRLNTTINTSKVSSP